MIPVRHAASKAQALSPYTRPSMDLPHEFKDEALLELALTHSSTYTKSSF